LRIVDPVMLPDPGPLRIILVDDDPVVIEGMIAIMVRIGWEPLVATTVAEALEVVESEGTPDALITDLRLAKNECGLDVIAAIHHKTGQTVPVVIITGDASHPRLAEAMSSPWPILVKPFSTLALYNAVTAMVAKARPPPKE
jgi:DNA-binding NtrC family response regulator